MRSSDDKNNNNFRQNEADMFNAALDSLALIEIPLLDRLYTWSSNLGQPTLEKIDRVFINNAWSTTFPNTTLSSLTRFVSDHVSLLLQISTTIPRPALFRFKNAWASHPHRGPAITAWSIQPNTAADPAKQISISLKRSRQALKCWRIFFVPVLVQENNCKIVISTLDTLE